MLNARFGWVSPDGSLAGSVSGYRGYSPNGGTNLKLGKGPGHPVKRGRNRSAWTGKARDPREEHDQPSSPTATFLIFGERDRRISRLGQTRGKYNCVLDGLAATLAKVRAHGMSGVAHKCHCSVAPTVRHGAVNDLIPHEPLGRGGCQEIGDGVGPLAERVF